MSNADFIDSIKTPIKNTAFALTHWINKIIQITLQKK